MSVENTFKMIPHIRFSAQNYSKAVGSLWGWQRTEMRLASTRLDPVGSRGRLHSFTSFLPYIFQNLGEGTVFSHKISQISD